MDNNIVEAELVVVESELKDVLNKGFKVCCPNCHDPSGIDMSRDIEDRLNMFLQGGVFHPKPIALNFKRIALNMDQIRKYKPPPNFAKTTDARFADYQSKFGKDSWELDALEPKVIANLIQDEIQDVIDEDAWASSMARENKEKKVIEKIATGLRK